MNILTLARVFSLSAVLAVAALAADVTGKWTAKMETPNGTRDMTLNLKQEGEALTGSMPWRNGDTPISDGSVKGDDVAFSVTRKFQGEERKTNYKGKVAGDELKLKFEMMGQERELVFKKAQ